MNDILTLPCGCERKLETIRINGVETQVQVAGHTPDSPPLTDEDKRFIENIIMQHLRKKEEANNG